MHATLPSHTYTSAEHDDITALAIGLPYSSPYSQSVALGSLALSQQLAIPVSRWIIRAEIYPLARRCHHSKASSKVRDDIRGRTFPSDWLVQRVHSLRDVGSSQPVTAKSKVKTAASRFLWSCQSSVASLAARDRDSVARIAQSVVCHHEQERACTRHRLLNNQAMRTVWEA